jgi:hypothetical protein
MSGLAPLALAERERSRKVPGRLCGLRLSNICAVNVQSVQDVLSSSVAER